MNTRRGFSLVEVLVVLILIALMAAVSGLAIRGGPVPQGGWRDQLLAARGRAAQSGMIVTGFADSIGAFSVHPSGMIVVDSEPRIRFGLDQHAR